MLSSKTLFDRLEDYKSQYGVSAGARIGVLPASTASVGAGEGSASCGDAQAVTKSSDLDLFLRIKPGEKGHRLKKSGSSIDSLLGPDGSLGSIRDRLLPAPADDVLTSLGFSGSASFIPERFARNWCEKMTRVKMERLKAMEEEEEEMRGRVAAAAMLKASQEGEQGGSSLNWKDVGIERSLHGVEVKVRPRSGRKWLRRALSAVTREQHAKGRLQKMGLSETMFNTDHLFHTIDSNWPSHFSFVDTGSKNHASLNDVNHPEHPKTMEVNSSETNADLKLQIPNCSRVAISENCKLLSDMRNSEMNNPISTDSVFSLLTKPKNILPPSNSERPSVETVPLSQSFTPEGSSEILVPQKVEESVQNVKLSLKNNVAVDSVTTSTIPESVGRTLVAEIIHNIDSTGVVDIPVSSSSDQLHDADERMDGTSSDKFVDDSLSERSKEVQTDDRTLSPIMFSKFEQNYNECTDDDDSFISVSPFQSDLGEDTDEINQTMQAKDEDSEADVCLTNAVLTEMEHEDRLILNVTLDSEALKCLTNDAPVSRKQKVKLECAMNDKKYTVDLSTLLCTTCLSTIRSMIRQQLDWDTLCARSLGRTTKNNLKITGQTDKKLNTKPTTFDATKGAKAKGKNRKRRCLVKRNVRIQKKSHVVGGAYFSKPVKTRQLRRLVAGRLVGLTLREKRTTQTFRSELRKISIATKDEAVLDRGLQQNDVEDVEEEEGVASMDLRWSESAELQPRVFEDLIEPLHDRKTVSSNTCLGSRKMRRARLRFASRKSLSLDAEDPRTMSFWDDDESAGEPPGRAVVNYYSLREWSCISDVVNSLRSSSTTGLVAAEPHLSKDASHDLSRIFSGGGGYNRIQSKTGLDPADLLESFRKDPDDDADSAVDCSEHRKSCHRNWFRIQKSVKELIQAEEDSDVEEESAPLRPLMLEEGGSFDALSIDEDDESGLNATLPEMECNNPRDSEIRDSAMPNGFESASVRPLQDVLYFGSVESTRISSNEVFDADGSTILPLQVGLLNERNSESKENDTDDDLLVELSEDECDDFRQLRLVGSLDVHVTDQTGDSCSALVSEWLVNSKDSNHSNMNDIENKDTSSFAVMGLNESTGSALNPGTRPVSLPLPFEVESPKHASHSLSHRNDVDVTSVGLFSSSPLTLSVDSSGNSGSENSDSNCYSCCTTALDEKESSVSHDSFVSESISNGSEEAQDPQRHNGFIEEATLLPANASSRAGPADTSGGYGISRSTSRSLFLQNCNNGGNYVDKTDIDQIDWLQGNVLRKIRHFETKYNTVRDDGRGKTASRRRPGLINAQGAGETEALTSHRMLKDRMNLKEKKEDDDQLQDEHYRTSVDLSETLLDLSESATQNRTETCLVNIDGQAQNQYSTKSVSNRIVMEMCRRFESSNNSQLLPTSVSNNRTSSTSRNDLLSSQAHQAMHSRGTDSSTTLLSSSISKDILENLKGKLEQRFLKTSEAWNDLQKDVPASVHQFTTHDLEELIQSAADETTNKFLSQQHPALPHPPST